MSTTETEALEMLVDIEREIRRYGSRLSASGRWKPSANDGTDLAARSTSRP